METNMNGLSLDFIIHPGETIKEVLEDNNMLQEELANRIGFSAKHVSEVVNGKKGISPQFAKGLEYVFGIPTTFWLNLQNIYDKELIEFKEKNEISKKELEIALMLEPILKYAYELKLIEKYQNDVEKVIVARNLCRITNLNNLEKVLNVQTAYRTAAKQNVNPYILCVWQRVCEILADKETIQEDFSKEKLQNSLDKIKALMFEKNPKVIIKKLKSILSECGIIFEIVKHFTGAPIQGFIKKKDNKILLCMTLRQSYADIFWFTLFHEVGHILNNDINGNILDYYLENTEKENKADSFAKSVLINESDYIEFIKKEEFSISKIEEFAKKEGIPKFIVIGRLQKDGKIPYAKYAEFKIRYKWE